MGQHSELEVSTTINAAPSAVWVILTDTPRYPDWHPQCADVEGDVALGRRIRTVPAAAEHDGRPADHGVATAGYRITELVPGQRMTWENTMPLGLFRSVRTFTLERVAGGRTQLTVRQVSSGPLLKLKRNAIPASSESLERFAAALKARSEQSALALAV